MIRRLVKESAANGGRFSEVDLIVVKRSAQVLKNYIERCIDPNDDICHIHRNALPLCIGALDGSLKLPLRHNASPFDNPALEGLLPESFKSHWADFFVTANGSHLEEPEEVIIDGATYAYMTFEEPGDWPTVVKQYEAECEERWRDKHHWDNEKRHQVDARVKQRKEMLAAEEQQMAEALRNKRLAEK